MTHSRGYLAYALGLNYAAMMSLAIVINLLPVFLTTLGAELGGEAGLTKEELGRIGMVTFAGLVLGILVSGPLADRLAQRKIENILSTGARIVLASNAGCLLQIQREVRQRKRGVLAVGLADNGQRDRRGGLQCNERSC